MLKANRNRWLRSTSETFSLILATLSGIWLDHLLTNDPATWGAWSGYVGLLIISPFTILAIMFSFRKARRLGAQLASKFTIPTVRIAGWCLALSAGALFSSAVFDLHHWWFGVLAIAIYSIPIVMGTSYLKMVESEVEDKKKSAKSHSC